MEETILINTDKIKLESDRETLKEVINDMNEKGYNAYKQITEYILTGEIGYISSYKDSRSKMSKINRRDLTELMLREFTK